MERQLKTLARSPGGGPRPGCAGRDGQGRRVARHDRLQNSWEETIRRERYQRLETYRQLTLGKTSIWNDWRQGLPQGKRLALAAMARLRSTARATDTHPVVPHRSRASPSQCSTRSGALTPRLRSTNTPYGACCAPPPVCTASDPTGEEISAESGAPLLARIADASELDL